MNYHLAQGAARRARPGRDNRYQLAYCRDVSWLSGTTAYEANSYWFMGSTSSAAVGGVWEGDDASHRWAHNTVAQYGGGHTYIASYSEAFGQPTRTRSSIHVTCATDCLILRRSFWNVGPWAKPKKNKQHQVSKNTNGINMSFNNTSRAANLWRFNPNFLQIGPSCKCRMD
jgi:hypothetical protein